MATATQLCLLLVASALIVADCLAAPRGSSGGTSTSKSRRRLHDILVQLGKRWNHEMGGCHCRAFKVECWNHHVCKQRHGAASTCRKNCCGTKCTGAGKPKPPPK